MKKKSLLLVLAGYVLWGVLPLYWGVLTGLDSFVILACRFVMSAVSTLVLLAATHRLPALFQVLRDRQAMKFLVPAALTITVNWGLFIWAVGQGRVMDASLGYYMNPLMVFLFGILVFKERCGKLELFALLLAVAGVVLSTLQYGAFPYIALALATSFSVYGTLKKFAHVDGLVSVAAETLLLTPVMLLFLLFAPQSHATFAAATPLQLIFLAGAGIVTATPMVLYSGGVNDLPFTTMGFLQYICPTLMLIIGVTLMGETFSAAKAVSFAFIGAGLILFTIGLYRRERAQAALAKAGPAAQSAE